MERMEAEAVLGVAPGASPVDVRRAYRQLVRQHHPDVAGHGTTAFTARLTEAYRVLRDAPEDDNRDQDAAPPPRAPTVAAVVVTAADDTLTIGLPADEAFFSLLELAHRIGDVTYVDPESGLIEALVHFDDGSAGSAVLTLQGRANGTTDAFCTLAPRSRLRPPPAAVLVAEMAALMSVAGPTEA